jgi:hypothetical protein
MVAWNYRILNYGINRILGNAKKVSNAGFVKVIGTIFVTSHFIWQMIPTIFEAKMEPL